MKRFLINCYTHWCGEDNTYTAYAESESDKRLNEAAQMAAYDNFSDYDGFSGVLVDMFDTDDESELTKDEIQEAIDNENEYYSFIIEPWDYDRSEEEWEWYDVIYDGRK